MLLIGCAELSDRVVQLCDELREEAVESSDVSYVLVRVR